VSLCKQLNIVISSAKNKDNLIKKIVPKVSKKEKGELHQLINTVIGQQQIAKRPNNTNNNNDNEDDEEDENESSDVESEGEEIEVQGNNNPTASRQVVLNMGTKIHDAIYFPGHIAFLASSSKFGDEAHTYIKLLGNGVKHNYINNQYYQNGNNGRANGMFREPAKRTNIDTLSQILEIESCDNDISSRESLEKKYGFKGWPAFIRLHSYFNFVDNTVNDPMHIFSDVMILIFEYIIRDHYNNTRRKQFLSEQRSVYWNNETITQQELHQQWVTLQSYFVQYYNQL
jgi:hypothetical protein